MRTWKAFLALALAVACGARLYAATDDPLHSPGCTDARVALEVVLDEPVQAHRENPERLARARKLVADHCLGRTSGHAQRAGAPEPPMAVPAPVIEVPRPAQARPRVAVPAPAVVVPRTAAITACDPAGCWDSNGQRLNYAGPSLLGPRGVCVPLAGQVSCP